MDEFVKVHLKRSGDPSLFLSWMSGLIVSRGSSEQFINWLNGLKNEQESLLGALHAVTNETETPENVGFVCVKCKAKSLRLKDLPIQTPSDDVQEKGWSD